MRLFILMVLSVYSLSGQSIKIPLDLEKKVASPIIYTDARSSNLVWVFYKEKFDHDQFFLVMETNSSNAIIRKSKTELKTILGKPSGKIEYIGHYKTESSYVSYFWLDSDDIFCLTINAKDFKSSINKVYSPADKEKVFGGLECSGGYYIVSRLLARKNKSYFRFVRLEGEQMKHDWVCTGELPSHIFDKNVDVTVVSSPIEPPPDKAVADCKVYSENDKLYITIDQVAGSSERKIPITYFVILDPVEKSIITQRVVVSDAQEVHFEPKANSFYFNNHIFQIYSAHEQMGIYVRIAAKPFDVVYKKVVLPDDSLDFANSPIVLEGRGSMGMDREYERGKKFIKRFAKYSPFIHVRKIESNYMLAMGGHNVITSGGGGGGFVGGTPGITVNAPGGTVSVPGTPGTFIGGGGGSYERSGSFCTILDSSLTRKVDKLIPKTLVTKLAETSLATPPPRWKPHDSVSRMENLYYINDAVWFGAYSKGKNEYWLTKLDD